MTFAGGQCLDLHDLPAAALAVLIPWPGSYGFHRRAGRHPRRTLCWIEGGAGFFIFSVLLGGAVELPGRSRPAPGVVTFAGGLPRVPSRSSTRAREALMMAGAGGAMRATGRRVTAIRFQQLR